MRGFMPSLSRAGASRSIGDDPAGTLGCGFPYPALSRLPGGPRRARRDRDRVSRLARVERFYDRHGAKAILIGRFIGLVRAVSPFLAGASGLRTRAFLPWSLLGTGVWAAAYTLAGYAFHRSFAAATHVLTYGALGLAVVAAVVLALRARRPASL